MDDAGASLQTQMRAMGRAARTAAAALRLCDADARTRAITAMASAVRAAAPDALVTVEAIPLLPSGKPDRQALARLVAARR